MRAKGATYQQIGDAFGLSKERVRQIFRDTNPSLLGTFTKWRNSQIIKMREDGKTYAEIADEFGIKPNMARSIIRKIKPKLGEATLSSEDSPPPVDYGEYNWLRDRIGVRASYVPEVISRYKRIKALADEGLNITEISKELGIHYGTIQRYLRKYDIEATNGRYK